MFYDDETERDILHQSTSKTPENKGNKLLIKPQILQPQVLQPQKMEPRKIGGSSSGVSVYKPASKKMKGGATTKRKPNAWQYMIKKVMSEKSLNFKDSIKYIKQNNLY